MRWKPALFHDNLLRLYLLPRSCTLLGKTITFSLPPIASRLPCKSGLCFHLFAARKAILLILCFCYSWDGFEILACHWAARLYSNAGLVQWNTLIRGIKIFQTLVTGKGCAGVTNAYRCIVWCSECYCEEMYRVLVYSRQVIKADKKLL